MSQPQPTLQPAIEMLVPQLNLTEVVARAATIEERFRTAFIATERAGEYGRWLDELRLLKQCGRVIGPGEVGKSRTSLHYCQEDRRRVAYVKAWSNSSSRQLFSQLLQAVNHAAPRGRRQELRARLAGCLQPFGIGLLLVDNADNLQREALLDLKQLHEESGVPIVLIGGLELDGHLQTAHLLGGFPALFEFDRLDYLDFQKTLRTIELDILVLPQASHLAEGTLFELLASASQAHLGVLIKILTQATLHSLQHGHGRVDPAILARIANRYSQPYLPLEARHKPEPGLGSPG